MDIILFCLLGWFQWRTIAQWLPPGGRALPSALDNVAAGPGGGADAYPDWVVPPALELGRATICRLNTNLIVWIKKLVIFYRYGSKKIRKKFLKISNFVTPPYKYPHGLSSFHTPSITFSLYSSHTQCLHPTHHGVSGRHGRSHEHVASGRGRVCRRFFINTRAKASSMIRQPWSWSGSFQAVTRLLRRRLRVLPPSYFRRRYRMRMTLFLSIMHKLSETSPYFYEMYDATGRADLTAL
jgi:hypothetical protein